MVVLFGLRFLLDLAYELFDYFALAKPIQYDLAYDFGGATNDHPTSDAFGYVSMGCCGFSSTEFEHVLCHIDGWFVRPDVRIVSGTDYPFLYATSRIYYPVLDSIYAPVDSVPDRCERTIEGALGIDMMRDHRQRVGYAPPGRRP